MYRVSQQVPDEYQSFLELKSDLSKFYRKIQKFSIQKINMQLLFLPNVCEHDQLFVLH